MDEERDPLYNEAMFMADMYGIPRIVANDYYDAFIEFVREEFNNRIKTGVIKQQIHPEILITVLMGEANIG